MLARIIGGMDVKIICREVCIYIEDTRTDKSGLAFQREREREKKRRWRLRRNNGCLKKIFYDSERYGQRCKRLRRKDCWAGSRLFLIHNYFLALKKIKMAIKLVSKKILVYPRTCLMLVHPTSTRMAMIEVICYRT